MPRKYIVKEIDHKTSEHRHLHFLNLPTPTEPGFYRQITSLNAFAWGRHRRNWSDTTLYYVLREEEFNIDLISMRKWIPDYENALPRSEYDSIWAFYEAIGYDHKKNKYDTTRTSGKRKT